MNAKEKAIRERAYQLWDQAGRPEGRSQEFWLAAKAELESQERSGKKKPGVRRSADVRSETAADWTKRRRDPSF
ncbi:DUF2934 domain-containing protein [Roseiarcus sp.]|uniref:DUF2934 domain-containing protein n=1 Tax=Roseiarcus sp. TaxID=1969460 RepID=UPI003F9856AC